MYVNHIVSPLFSGGIDFGLCDMLQGIPGKGAILTKLSLFWFEKLESVIPNHLITANVDEMPSEIQVHAAALQGRSMLVRKAKVIPLEAIVRGYITGIFFLFLSSVAYD